MEPEPYTQQQIESFQAEFVRRRKRQILLTLIMILAALLYAFDSGGILSPILGIPGVMYLIIFIILLIPAYRNWSCPACKRMFGRSGGLNPSHCRFCGIPLRP
jgi:hypothetical protein